MTDSIRRSFFTPPSPEYSQIAERHNGFEGTIEYSNYLLRENPFEFRRIIQNPEEVLAWMCDFDNALVKTLPENREYILNAVQKITRQITESANLKFEFNNDHIAYANYLGSIVKKFFEVPYMHHETNTVANVIPIEGSKLVSLLQSYSSIIPDFTDAEIVSMVSTYINGKNSSERGLNIYRDDAFRNIKMLLQVTFGEPAENSKKLYKSERLIAENPGFVSAVSSVLDDLISLMRSYGIEHGSQLYLHKRYEIRDLLDYINLIVVDNPLFASQKITLENMYQKSQKTDLIVEGHDVTIVEQDVYEELFGQRPALLQIDDIKQQYLRFGTSCNEINKVVYLYRAAGGNPIEFIEWVAENECSINEPSEYLNLFLLMYKIQNHAENLQHWETLKNQQKYIEVLKATWKNSGIEYGLESCYAYSNMITSHVDFQQMIDELGPDKVLPPHAALTVNYVAYLFSKHHLYAMEYRTTKDEKPNGSILHPRTHTMISTLVTRLEQERHHFSDGVDENDPSQVFKLINLEDINTKIDILKKARERLENQQRI